MYKKYTLVPEDTLEWFKSEARAGTFDKSDTELTHKQKAQLIRLYVSLRQDFYLGLLATSGMAMIFQKNIFPRYLSHSNTCKSMTDATLEWIRDEFKFESWNSFGKHFAAAASNNAAETYAKDLLKRWRKSSCNCRCKNECRCSPIADQQIATLCKRVKSVRRDARAAGLVAVEGLQGIRSSLIYARAIDNLLSSISKPFDVWDSAGDHWFQDCVTAEFRQSISRFDEYLQNYSPSV